MKITFEGKLKEEIVRRSKKAGFEFSEAFWLKNYLIKLWNLNEKIENKHLNLKKAKAGRKNLMLYNLRRKNEASKF